jgi:VanZ family protein
MAVKHLIPAFAWACIIFVAISIPGSSIPQTGLLKIPHFDKIIHTSLFGVLGFLLSYGFYRQKSAAWSRNHYGLITILTGIFYGAITEILQYYFFQGRHGSFYDFLANTFGTVFGVIIFTTLGKPLVRSWFEKS